jgi:hypothetical protein
LPERVSIFGRLIYPGRRKYAAAAEIVEHPHRTSLVYGFWLLTDRNLPFTAPPVY